MPIMLGISGLSGGGGGAASRVDMLTVTDSSSGADTENFLLPVVATQTYLRSTANGGSLRADGYDNAIYADPAGGTPLPFAVKQWSATTGEWIGFVKVPLRYTPRPASMPDKLTRVYRRVADPTVTTNQANRATTFSQFTNVGMMVNASDDGATVVGTPTAGTSPLGTTMIPASGSYWHYPASGVNGWTVVVKTPATLANDCINMDVAGAYPYHSSRFHLDADGKMHFDGYGNGGSPSYTGTATLTTNTTYVISCDYVNSGTVRCFVNGVLDISAAMNNPDNMPQLRLQGAGCAYSLLLHHGVLSTDAYAAYAAELITPTSIYTDVVWDSTPAQPDYVMHAEIGVSNVNFPGNRRPTFMSAARLAEMQALYNTSDPVFRVCMDNAVAQQGSFGLYAAYRYLILNDATAAAAALVALEAEIDAYYTAFDDSYGNLNNTREYLGGMIFCFDLIYAGINSTERTRVCNKLLKWALQVSGQSLTASYQGTAYNDSDVSTTHYIIALALHVMNVPENTWYGNGLTRGIYKFGVPDSHVAGQLRTIFREWVEVRAAGGEWIEGSGYNPGTCQMIWQGRHSFRDAFAYDYFPDWTTFASEQARFALACYMPGLTEDLQWGDDERPRTFGGGAGLYDYEHISQAVNLERVLQETSDPFATTLRKWTDTVFANYPVWLSNATNRSFCTRGYIHRAPPITAAADLTAIPESVESTYMGHMVVRDHGIGTVMAANGYQMSGVDHFGELGRDLVIFRNGEWALDHAVGYGGESSGAIGNNSFMSQELSASWDTKKRIWSSSGVSTNGRKWYAHALRHAGVRYQATPFNNYVSITVMFPNFAGRAVAVIYEYVDTNKLVAASMPDDSGLIYLFKEKSKVARATAQGEYHQQVWHHPVVATQGAGYITWAAAGSQTVRVTNLAPAVGYNAYDEDALMLISDGFTEYSWIAAERKQQTRAIPTVEADIETWLTVVDAFNTADSPLSVSRVGNVVTVGTEVVTFTPWVSLASPGAVAVA